MTVVINGTTGITNDGGYTGDGIVFADTTPANTLVTTTGGNVGIGTSTPTQKLHVYAASGSIYGLIQSGASAVNAGLILSQGNNTYYHITDAAGWQLFDNTSTQLRVNTNGNFSFNSGYGSATVAYGCRAWVNFNGQGTVAIRGSGNVSSITDNGVANYTLNFSTAMPDVNYCLTGMSGNNDTSLECVVQNYNTSAPATSSVRVRVARIDGTMDVDPPIVCVSIFR